MTVLISIVVFTLIVLSISLILTHLRINAEIRLIKHDVEKLDTARKGLKVRVEEAKRLIEQSDNELRDLRRELDVRLPPIPSEPEN